MKLKIACIGTGYFARFHIEAWQRIESTTLVALCDTDRAKLKETAGLYNVENTYTDVEELLTSGEADVVDIITPPETHTALCQLAWRHGKNVICQKPLTPGLPESQTLIKSAAASGRRLIIHENFRFQPWYVQLKQLLEGGAIGADIHTIYHRMKMGDGWQEEAYLDRQPYFRAMPRLLIHETGVHFIDVFRYLAGDVSSVFSKLRSLNRSIAGEDTGLVFFQFESGAQGILDASRYNESLADDPRYTFGEMTIEGSGGTLYLRSDGSIILHALGRQPVTIDYQHEDRQFAGDCVYHTQKAIADSLMMGVPFETEGTHYLKNLIVQEAIYKSNQLRAEVDIEGVL